ncbi:MAG: HAD family phosphatase [Bacteroidales bacterium]|nr:HAD family phosphatase [Bacteroidales bacterium]
MNNKKISELKNIKAVIFDMDGLLVNSEPLWQQAEIKVFNKIGIKLSANECKQFQGIRIEDVVPMLIKKYNYNFKTADEIVLDIVNEMLILLENVEVLPGVIDCIEYYFEQKIPMAIASSSKMVMINKVVDRMKIRDKITLLHSAEFEKAGKPEPDIFLSAAKMLNILPEKCLVFEDSIFGVQAAIKAGMKVIAIPFPEFYNSFEFNNVDFKIKTMNNWLEFIKN